MAKLMTLSARVEPDLYELVTTDAGETGMSLSQWLIEAINSYLTYGDFDWDDLVKLDWDELIELVDDQELDVDPDDYKSFWGVKDVDGLRDAIADKLDIEMPEGLDWDELCGFDWEMLSNEDLLERFEIDVNPADYDNEDDLREAIANELDIEIPGEEE